MKHFSQRNTKPATTTKSTLFFAQNLRDIGTRRIRLKQVSSINFCSGSASATNFAELTNTTLALQVAAVSKLESEF